MEPEKTFPGIALHEKFKNGKAAGQIILTDGTVRFQSDQGGVEIPLHDITLKRGGSGGQLVTFEHRSYPGWYIYTEEKSILRKLDQLSGLDTGISAQVKGIKKIRRRIRGIILGIILTIAALMLILLHIRNPFSKAIAGSIPVEWEQALGESVFEQYKAQKKFIDDPGVIASLDKITAPLLSRIPGRRYDFKVYIVRDPSINAFALPGGYMALHTGLLLNVEHAGELLGVLAHEIAHVTLQHGMRKLIDSLGLLLMIKAFFGDASGIWGEVIRSGAFLLDQQFSRSFEREADETGFSYLVNAGIDPGGMVGFFQRLEAERKKVDTLNIEETLNFLSTHPAPAMRIKYLNKKLKQLGKRGGFLDFEADFRVFKETLKRKVQETRAGN